jgi:hypothetical protein
MEQKAQFPYDLHCAGCCHGYLTNNRGYTQEIGQYSVKFGEFFFHVKSFIRFFWLLDEMFSVVLCLNGR